MQIYTFIFPQNYVVCKGQTYIFTNKDGDYISDPNDNTFWKPLLEPLMAYI